MKDYAFFPLEKDAHIQLQNDYALELKKGTTYIAIEKSDDCENIIVDVWKGTVLAGHEIIPRYLTPNLDKKLQDLIVQRTKEDKKKQ